MNTGWAYLSRPSGDGLFYTSISFWYGNPVPSPRDGLFHMTLEKENVRSRPVPTGTDYSNRERIERINHAVPSLRGRIVLPRLHSKRKQYRPVPAGTDCSTRRTSTRRGRLSRPYGDGLFFYDF